MEKIKSLQPMWSNLQALYKDCFAYGIVTDHRADWALAAYYQQPELDSHTIQRNPG